MKGTNAERGERKVDKEEVTFEKKKQEKLRHLSRAIRHNDMVREELDDYILYLKRVEMEKSCQVYMENWIEEVIRKEVDEVTASLVQEYAGEVDALREKEEGMREKEHNEILKDAKEYSRQAGMITAAAVVFAILNVIMTIINFVCLIKR